MGGGHIGQHPPHKLCTRRAHLTNSAGGNKASRCHRGGSGLTESHLREVILGAFDLERSEKPLQRGRYSRIDPTGISLSLRHMCYLEAELLPSILIFLGGIGHRLRARQEGLQWTLTRGGGRRPPPAEGLKVLESGL